MIARASRLQVTDQAGASLLWSKVDRAITDQAPWVTMHVNVIPDFVSRRADNYKYCWLSAFAGSTGAYLDQLWVR